MFELIARILAFFYDLIPSYGFAIAMLTMCVMVVFMPLTFKSTKSMIAMRRIQPELKALQAKHADDKETLNKEMMALYQERGVNPVGGCLPVLFQAPVFYVLFRVVRGITRRTSDVGYVNGSATASGGLAETGVEVQLPGAIEAPTKNFNPEYLDDLQDSGLYTDLINSNEMLSWGIDLSRSASEALTTSIPSSIPYLVMVVITGFLSWFQQKQIQGRMKTAEMNPQMQMITKVMPWFLPVFAFTMPAALVVYFIVSALFRVGQQAVITRRYYGDEDEFISDTVAGDDAADSGMAKVEQAYTERANGSTERATATAAASAGSGGMLGTLLGTDNKPATPSDRHGSRRPASGTTSARKRTRPPRETTATKTDTRVDKKTASKADASSKGAKPESAWARAKRTATSGESSNSRSSTNGSSSRRRGRQEPANEPAPGKPSKRVTAKGDGKPHSQTRNNKKKRK